MNLFFTKKTIVVFGLILLSTTYISAEGYQVNALSAKQGGMANVGTALKLRAESMHFNPAGLAFMDKTLDLSAGVSAVFSNAEFSQTQEDGSYKHKSDTKPSTPIYFYGGFKIYDFLSAGISVNTPYGSSMDWGTNWAGSGLIQDISLKSFSIQPTLAYKINDRLSVGAGMMIMFGDFSLSRALIPAGAMNALGALAPAVSATHPGYDLTAELNKYKDIPAYSATLKGDAGVRLGFNIGAMFDITDRITVGVSYRSKVKMKVKEGKAGLDYANESHLREMAAIVNPIAEQLLGKVNAIPLLPLDKGTFKAELPLPSNLTFGVAYRPMEKLLLAGEVQFVGWSAYKELNVQFSQEVLGGYNINAEKKYKNSRIYRLAGEYKATDRLNLRLGFYFDESPVRKNYLNPETPSMNKLGTTVGASFYPTERFSVDFSFAYITGFGRDGSYPYPGGTVFEGHYEVYAINPTIGLAYSF